MNEIFDLGLEIEDKKRNVFADIFNEEKLLRLNPHWKIEEFTMVGELFRADICDHATEFSFTLEGELLFFADSAEEHLMRIELKDFGAGSILFYIQEGKLSVSVDWVDEEHEAAKRDDILRWIAGIREYVRLYLKASPNTFLFRFVMNYILLRMNPSQRKITTMIFKISLVEIILITAIVVGFVIFN